MWGKYQRLICLFFFLTGRRKLVTQATDNLENARLNCPMGPVSFSA